MVGMQLVLCFEDESILKMVARFSSACHLTFAQNQYLLLQELFSKFFNISKIDKQHQENQYANETTSVSSCALDLLTTDSPCLIFLNQTAENSNFLIRFTWLQEPQHN